MMIPQNKVMACGNDLLDQSQILDESKITERRKQKGPNQGMDLTVAVAQQINRFIAAGKV